MVNDVADTNREAFHFDLLTHTPEHLGLTDRTVFEIGQAIMHAGDWNGCPLRLTMKAAFKFGNDYLIDQIDAVRAEGPVPFAAPLRSLFAEALTSDRKVMLDEVVNLALACQNLSSSSASEGA